LGTMMVFYFTGLAVAAVGKTAGEVVLEVRVCVGGAVDSCTEHHIFHHYLNN